MSEKENNPIINEDRVERILSEYLVPDQKFRDEKIENMIVFFGSARAPSEEEASEIKKENPNNPKLSFNVYIDKDPSDTISIKYKTVQDVKDTIKKLERLYKTDKYTHKRIWQVGMILKVRLEAMYKHKKTKFPGAKNVYSRLKISSIHIKVWFYPTQLFYFSKTCIQ